MSLPEELIKELKAIVGEEYVTRDPHAIERYLYDETALGVRPQPIKEIIVVKPSKTEEVSEILKIANKYRVPVFVRGGGTGLLGGAIPTRPGIVMSMERMDKIAIDADNMVAEVEAGVTLGKLIEEAEKHNLAFPAHPGDEGAYIGGLIACNAGGARAVKTGVMRNYVLGLEVVLPTGEVLRIGAKSIKNVFGTNLMHLFIGSEGILGVITKAWIRLYPRWYHWATMVIPFTDRVSAFKTAKKILFSGIVPLALEYVDKRCVEYAAKYLGMTWPAKEGDYQLMLIFAEPTENILFEELEFVNRVAKEFGALEPIVAQRADEQKVILKIRSEIFTSLKPQTYDILDPAVPMGVTDKFVERILELERRYDIWLPTYGHLGDGNIHIHILYDPKLTVEQLEKIREEIYDIAISLGGTIAAEHGIGTIRRKYVRKYLGNIWVEVMKKIKNVLDPNNILNSDKVIPD